MVLRKLHGVSGGFRESQRCSSRSNWRLREFQEILGGLNGVSGTFQGVSKALQVISGGSSGIPEGLMGFSNGLVLGGFRGYQKI